MKLREVLEQHKGEVVRIGSATSFFYISDNGDSTIEELERIDAELRQQAISKLNAARNALSDGIIERNFKMRLYKAKRYKKNGWISEETGKRIRSDAIEKCEKLLAMTKKEKEDYIFQVTEKYKDRVKECSEYLDNYVNVLDREVKDIYKSSFNNDTIILVTGTENGKYWSKKEYETGVIEADNDEED